jgi:hypothetical protein
MTSKENTKHSINVLGYKIKPVVQITLENKPIRTWVSGRQIERELGLRSYDISLVCRGKTKQAYGYKWAFLYDYVF